MLQRNHPQNLRREENFIKQIFNLDVPSSCWSEELLQQTQKDPQVPLVRRNGEVEWVGGSHSRHRGLGLKSQI
jgi:hypothetical protein